jgi:hypothetical protein
MFQRNICPSRCNGAHTDDFEECRMAITGGLEMPEGQLEAAGADVTQARRSRTVIKKHHAEAAAIIRSYQRDRSRRYHPDSEICSAYLAQKARSAIARKGHIKGHTVRGAVSVQPRLVNFETAFVPFSIGRTKTSPLIVHSLVGTRSSSPEESPVNTIFVNHSSRDSMRETR